MKDSTQLAIIAAGLGITALVIYKGASKVSGAVGATYDALKDQITVAGANAGALVTGNNWLTQGQTNAAGEPTTAYVGVPVAGTLGAAANSASGGYFASFGEWIGGKAYDIFGTDPMAQPIKTAPSIRADTEQRRYETQQTAGGVGLPAVTSFDPREYGFPI